MVMAGSSFVHARVEEYQVTLITAGNYRDSSGKLEEAEPEKQKDAYG